VHDGLSGGPFDQVPAYLGASCTIGIELWDGDNNSYGTPAQAKDYNASLLGGDVL
jgi:hypothetical protein